MPWPRCERALTGTCLSTPTIHAHSVHPFHLSLSCHGHDRDLKTHLSVKPHPSQAPPTVHFSLSLSEREPEPVFILTFRHFPCPSYPTENVSTSDSFFPQQHLCPFSPSVPHFQHKCRHFDIFSFYKFYEMYKNSNSNVTDKQGDCMYRGTR